MAVIRTAEEAMTNIKSGMTMMIGGFLGVGAPLSMIDNIADSNVKDLTLVSIVGGYAGGGVDIGKLSKNKQLKKFIGAHIGTDPELVKQYNTGELEIEFNPMGTLVERIRAAGAGLGAVITPTGLGTEMEEGREKIVVEGKEYLLYTPLKADVAIIKGFRADKSGNVEYRGTALNSNLVMATAADFVIAEVDEIVEVGEIPYNHVGTPGIFVDVIVQGKAFEDRKDYFEDLWSKSNKLR